MHHPPPDGFAKPLGGENLGSSTPHCVSAGKQRRRGFFVVMPSSGCLTIGLSFWRAEPPLEMQRLNYCATLGDAADGLVRDVEIARPAWFQGG
jgi:hypothetical protein